MLTIELLKSARTQGIPIKQAAEHFIQAFFEDLTTLRIEKADVYPKATDNIPEMVALVKKLIEKGYAYRSEDGSIYFNISKFKDYGKLARIQVSELKAGARVKVDDYEKEQASDFVLWKAWDPEDGDIFWNTEIGKGRPGWHIECSAMSMKYLGETFDIHCGGVDNLFPHHENEIAQSEAATGKEFVHYWLHNEHLLVEGKKMAKRLGNFFTVRDLIAKGYDPSAIRYLMISTHYRQQLNFTFEGLEAAKKTLERLANFVQRLLDVRIETSNGRVQQLVEKVQNDFEEAMDDDLNISVALAHLFDFVRDVNNLLDNNLLNRVEAQKIHSMMLQFDKALGVIGEVKKEEKLSREAEELVRKREEARKAKDYKTADEIREKLKTMGIIIEDTGQGVRWKAEKQ